MLQQLSELRELNIELWDCKYGGNEHASFGHELGPFMALRYLHTLQIGMSSTLTPNSLRALGQFEAELIDAGSKLKLKY